MQFKKWHIKTLLLGSIPILVLLFFTWIRASSMLGRVTDPDPGLFESFAYHMQQGKVLYADIWDHKPPLIFYLNLWFLQLFGTSEDAIGYGSLIFCLLQTVVFYKLLLKFSKNQWAAFGGTLLFISTFFSVYVFGSGNYTEQYGVLCTTSGLLFFLDYIRKKHTLSLWISGILFGTAIWFKEPFLFSAMPYFIFLLVQFLRKKTKWLHLLEFILAFLVPALVVANAIVLTGSKAGYLEHLVHSKLYAMSSNTEPLITKILDNRLGFFGAIPLTNWVVIGLVIVGGIFLFIRPQNRIWITLVFAQQVFDYLGTGMSGNRFFHYYLQTIPLTLIIMIAAISQAGELWALLKKYKITFVPVIFFVAFLIAKQNPWLDLSWTPEKKFKDPIVEYLDQNEYYKPRSVALAGKDIGCYLLRAQGISEVRYIVPYPYHWIKIPGKEKDFQMNEDKQRFLDWNPQYVIYSGTFTEMYQDCQLDSFILKNYYEVALTDMMPGATAHLLKRKDEEK
jgi:4-amino-4-deoxy-L-arabinose transferase-like glycosyltransferase